MQHLKIELGDDSFCLVPTIYAGHFCGIIREAQYAKFLAAMPVQSLEFLEYIERNEFCEKVLDENRVQDVEVIGSRQLFKSVIPYDEC